MKRFAIGRTRFALVLAAALALAAGLIAASQISANNDRSAPPRTRPAPLSLFAGIPQDGAVLGRTTAPVTLVEYADLQCPYCAVWARQTLPTLVSDYVRTGLLRIVFRGLAFLGPDSEVGLAAAVAAGRQDRLWDLVGALYEQQGIENSGWISQQLDGIVDTLPGLDRVRLSRDRSGFWVHRQIAQAARAARAAHIPGTPSFEIGPTGGRLKLVALRSLDPNGIRPAIEAALAR